MSVNVSVFVPETPRVVLIGNDYREPVVEIPARGGHVWLYCQSPEHLREIGEELMNRADEARGRLIQEQARRVATAVQDGIVAALS